MNSPETAPSEDSKGACSVKLIRTDAEKRELIEVLKTLEGLKKKLHGWLMS